MTETAKKSYADYLALGYEVVAAYYAEGFHFQVLQLNEDVVIVQMSHADVIAGAFLVAGDALITRLIK